MYLDALCVVTIIGEQPFCAHGRLTIFVAHGIEGRELKTKKCVKGWAGWTPASEAEKAKFQELVLCPRSDHSDAALRGTEDGEGLVLLHDRPVGAAAEVKATTTSSRNRNKFCVPEEIRQMASDEAKCQNPLKKQLRNIDRKARREFEAGRAVQPRAKVINTSVVTELWVNGRASEDRDEWTEEVRAHCERCHDDKAETSEVQAERIRRQRVSGDRRVAPQGRRVQITVNSVLRARGKVLRNKANGPTDCLVTEMLQCLPTETVYVVAHWFDKRFKGECRAPEAWTILRLVFLMKLDAKLEQGLRGFRAIAVLSAFSEWYTTVLVELLHEEKESVEWKSLSVGAERGVNCEHMQALVTNVFQRHLEWQEDRRTDLQPGMYRHNTAFMASVDVKTAFDVATSSVVSKILTLTGVHGHLTAASLAEMQDVQGSPCFVHRIHFLERATAHFFS